MRLKIIVMCTKRFHYQTFKFTKECKKKQQSKTENKEGKWNVLSAVYEDYYEEEEEEEEEEELVVVEVEKNNGTYTSHNLTENRTNQLTPWSRVLLEKVPVTQLLDNFPTFYGIRRFIIVFTRGRKSETLRSIS
jgi:hypothetical protein